MVSVQVIALYGSDLWWDQKEGSRQNNLWLLVNQLTRSTMGGLETTPRGE